MRPIRKELVKKEKVIVNIQRKDKFRFIVEIPPIKSHFQQQEVITEIKARVKRKLKKSGAIFYHVLLQTDEDERLQENWALNSLKSLDLSPFDFVFLIHKDSIGYSNMVLPQKGHSTIYIYVYPVLVPDQISA